MVGKPQRGQRKSKKSKNSSAPPHTAGKCHSQELCKKIMEVVSQEETNSGKHDVSLWHCNNKAFPNLDLLTFEPIANWKDALKHLKISHKQHQDVIRKWKLSGCQDCVEDVAAEDGFSDCAHSNWKILCLHQCCLENGLGAAVVEPVPEGVLQDSRADPKKKQGKRKAGKKGGGLHPSRNLTPQLQVPLPACWATPKSAPSSSKRLTITNLLSCSKQHLQCMATRLTT